MLSLTLAMCVSAADLDRSAVARLLRLPLAETEKPPATRLDLTLLGTLVDRGSYSVALIWDGTRAHTCFVRDELGGATVVSIARDRVLLDRDGVREELRSRRASPAPQPTAGAFSDLVRKQNDRFHVSIAAVMRELPTLMTQIRIVPEGPDTFRLFSIKKGSIFAWLGLEDGDLVRGLDFKNLRPGAPLALDVERAGRHFGLSGQLQ
jgi:general secretion pathway protein C